MHANLWFTLEQGEHLNGEREGWDGGKNRLWQAGKLMRKPLKLNQMDVAVGIKLLESYM